MNHTGDGPLTRSDMVSHAEAWIEAWNRRDLDAVLSAYAETACFRSPVAKLVTGDALVEGRKAMEAYWRAGLARLQTLEFELIATICDVEAQSMLVHYLASLNGHPRRACEIFRFENGQKVYAEALYGDDVAETLVDRDASARPDIREVE